MPFYFRKSISAGPFRFNFSNGGVGGSVGVTGFRIGSGPRGHYVHAGRSGIYYRATIGRAGARAAERSPTPVARPSAPATTFSGNVEMIEVDSGDVLAMRDENFTEMLDEINAKRRQSSMASILGWSLAALGVFAGLVVGPTGLLLSLLAPVGWAVGRWLDSYRRTCVLFYELEPEARHAYENMVHGFDRMAASAGKWHIESGGTVRDTTTWKRNAGASHIVRRKPTTLAYKVPPMVTCNVTPPAMHVGKQVIYFFPDIALVDDGRMVGAVGYDDLSVVWQDSDFIEERPVPKDAKIIYHTWRYPNKDGGPDRRFRNNYQIPVCRYEAMHLRSSNGVNELVEFSRVGVVAPFANALKALPRNAGAGAPRGLLPST